ncbi:uracil-DNA glycosylase [Rhodocyclus gracilis]
MSLSREAMLIEMGLGPLWKLRAVPAAEASPEVSVDAPESRSSGEADCASEASALVQTSAPPSPSLTTGEISVASPSATDGADDAPWQTLRREVVECRACALCEKRHQAVLGVGDPAADWLFIGEGPGADEDACGEPFVGAAGKLLDAMLAAISLRRGDDVYIANAVKCRPPGNRTPEAGEIAACRPYLERQVALLQPRLVVLLGRAAVQATLGLDVSLASLRGKPQVWEIAGQRIPLVVTYHPAYLLRSPLDKARAWEDLCRARALMGEAKAAAQ